METELTINIGGLPPFSARGCEQELTPITQGEFHRNINGDLIYLGNDTHTKYKSTIKCSDKAAIATDGLYRGREIELGCIQRLWQKFEANQREIYLDKTPVEGSLYAHSEDKTEIAILQSTDKHIQLDVPNAGGFICYRPKLTMRIIQYSLNTNEWGIKVGWQMECEEI
jgi:hypothetical protein